MSDWKSKSEMYERLYPDDWKFSDLSDEDKELYKSLAEKSLYHFYRQAWFVVEPGVNFVDNWHIHSLCKHLEATTKGELRNLIINMPPRCSKSIIVAVVFPSWVWVNNPEEKFIYSSYAHSLSIRDSVKCRRIIESDWYRDFWGEKVKLSKDENQRIQFSNTNQGMRYASSVLGTSTGLGGNYLVCMPYETVIDTSEGQLTIGSIVENELDVEVKSYNHSTDSVGYKKIENWITNDGTDKSLVKINLLSGDSLTCTSDHKIWDPVDRKYVFASNLEFGSGVLVDGGCDWVSSIDVLDRKETQVYDLTIQDNHNYFANGVLVSNCDDPNKAGEVRSKTKRDSVNDWWDLQMSTRGNDPKKTRKIIVQQRLHEEDLSGHLLGKGGYDLLCFPMEYKKGDNRTTTNLYPDPRTEDGELLWPDRIPKEQVEELKRELGSLEYAGQFDQRPSPAEGNMFKLDWIQYYDILPDKFDQVVTSADLTFDDGKENDYNVIQAWGKLKADRYLLGMVRFKAGFSEVIRQYVDFLKEWDTATVHLVEKKANGAALINVLKDKISGIIPITPTESKEQRAWACTPEFESGNVFFPNPKRYPWVETVTTEMINFPNGKNDDTVDSMSQALNRFRNSPAGWFADTSWMDSGALDEIDGYGLDNDHKGRLLQLLGAKNARRK